MATITKSTGTVTLSGTAEKVTLPAVYGWVWIKNMSDADMFAGLSEGISAGADGVLSIPSGDAGRIQTDGQDSVYLLGSGNALVVAQNYADCPFKAGVKGGGSDVDGKSSYTLTNAVDYPLVGLNLYGKSTQDGTPTPENPVEIVSVGDSGSVGVTACGKNLINLQSAKTLGNKSPEFVSNGFRTNAKDALSRIIFCDCNLIEGQTYYLSFDSTVENSTAKVEAFVKKNGTNNVQYNIANRSFVAQHDSDKIGFYIEESKAGDNVYFAVMNPQLEIGDTATAYEPYKGTAATITSAMPLCGIPVESGGNYTDGNGQQWVCDTLVYNADGSGKIVKSTDKIDSYNGESITTPFISTTGSLSTGATVIYQITEPQEIELTAAEMSELRELQTFNGITNIFNDGGADMDVKYCTNKTLSEYVMPITTGLQAQIDELKAAVLSLGGNV